MPRYVEVESLEDGTANLSSSNRTAPVTTPPNAQPTGPDTRTVDADVRNDRRRRLRLKVTPRGEYMLLSGGEGPCTVIDASSEAMAISADARADIDDTIIVHVDDIGSIIGTVVRLLKGGFVIKYSDEPRSVAAVSKLREWLRGLN